MQALSAVRKSQDEVKAQIINMQFAQLAQTQTRQSQEYPREGINHINTDEIVQHYVELNKHRNETANNQKINDQSVLIEEASAAEFDQELQYMDSS